jgi:hypothetical protein
MWQRDLFDIFPDLPRPKYRPAGTRIEEIRARAAEMQWRVRANAARYQAAVRLRHDLWRRTRVR